MLKPGDKAPDFELEAQDGRRVALHEFIGAKNVVLYFYPKDFTRGCTAETRSFGENYGVLQELGAEVIGVSSDDIESHREFAGECGAKFPLLADEEGRVRGLYGVQSSLGLIPGRATFIIDKEGVVRRVFSSQLNPRRHIAEAVEALKSLPK
ncbi:MAG: peroxiredoxin [Nitrososphaerales archaeon]|nr:peroxiredoxin [Nitrososphaerales archaeon]